MAAKKKKTGKKKESKDETAVEEAKDKKEESKSEEKPESKGEKQPEYVSDRADASKKDKVVSVDSFLIMILALSLLFNVFMVHKYGVMKGEIEMLSAGKLGVDAAGEAAGKDSTTRNTIKKPSSPGNNGETVKLDFYVMSQCPYGTQVLDAIAPVLEEVGDSVDFTVDYIAKKTGSGFDSLHGQTEVDGNIIQLCAMKHESEDYAYMDMIVCMDETYRNIPNNWEACADEAGLDVDTLRECYEGDEGVQLLEESIKRADEVGASGSPTIYLNGESYVGGRGSRDFLRAICNSLKGSKPQACSSIPEDPKFEAVIINDKRCGEDCDISMAISSLKQLFPSMTLKEYDYSSETGRQIYEDAGSPMLPLILLPPEVEDTENYGSVSRYLADAGEEYMSLMIGSKFDPTAEICDNEKDDTGNGKVDCDDEDCKGTLLCRQEIPEKLDVFVMSQCPYGVRGLDAMKEVIDNFGEDIDFNVNFIASYDENSGRFSALHGQPEVDENIRELCAIKHYPDDYKYMDYVWCRNKDITSTDWKPCVEEAGMDWETMKECAEGDEGSKLLQDNLKIAQELGIGASPTWMANNKYQFSGITADSIKTSYCKYNEGLDGCENTLTQTSDVPSSGSC